MIKGMTGFGTAEVSTQRGKIGIEIKSVNHRYFDLNFYFPSGFSSAEDKVRQVLAKQIKRGRVSVSIKITQKAQQIVSLNKEAIKKYIVSAKQISKEFKIKNDLTIADLISLPGVTETKESFIDPIIFWPKIEMGIKNALNCLLLMRQREGKSLYTDVSDKLRRMKIQLNKIKTRSNVILTAKKNIMTAEEFSSYQKNSDINEEITRLGHYIDEAKKLLSSNLSVGKRMDFVAQEMQRETNTIGSKQQDKMISNAVILLKSKIEKIREQAQNIE